jgi:5-methylcytosine-specific restriction enzyme A
MSFVRGNRAIRDHVRDGKRLLLFQTMGKGKQCLYRGEYALLRWEEKHAVPDTNGSPRKAIVFVLQRADIDKARLALRADRELVFAGAALTGTTALRITEIRTKQVLFRDRVELVEDGCRVTGIFDRRFLRASHIKPWAKSDGNERVDGHTPCEPAPVCRRQPMMQHPSPALRIPTIQTSLAPIHQHQRLRIALSAERGASREA